MTAAAIFQVRNRRGLGHLTRVHHLATALRRRRSDVKVHIHSSQPAPFDQRVSEFEYSDDLQMTWADRLAAVSPELAVYDTMLPDDADDGLPDQTKVAFVLRARERLDELDGHPFLSRIDRVIVPHPPGEALIPSSLRGRAAEVGVLSRTPDTFRGAAIRYAYCKSTGNPFVISTPGGGGFAAQADRFFEVTLAIHEALLERFGDLSHLCVLGPNYSNADIEQRLSAAPRLQVIRSLPSLADAFAAADLVIAEGGYNTVTELRLAKVPAVFLPSARGLDDQLARVRPLHDRGQAWVFDDSCTAAQVATTVRVAIDEQALAARREAAANDIVDLGNERAGMLLAELLA